MLRGWVQLKGGLGSERMVDLGLVGHIFLDKVEMLSVFNS